MFPRYSSRSCWPAECPEADGTLGLVPGDSCPQGDASARENGVLEAPRPHAEAPGGGRRVGIFPDAGFRAVRRRETMRKIMCTTRPKPTGLKKGRLQCVSFTFL